MGITNKISLLLLCFILVFQSCSKKATLQVDNETQSVVDNAIAEQEFMAIVPASQQHAINTKGTGALGKSQATPCDTLVKISGDTLWGKVGNVDPIYHLNISNNACSLTLPDSKTRTGLLSIRLTDKLKNPGAKMIIKMLNYKANNLDYGCDSMIVTTISSNTLFTSFNVKIVNGTVKQGTNWTVKYNLDRTLTNYPKGNPIGTEPYISIYGTANGINRHGKPFTASISEATPLIKHKNCQYIDKGILELTPDGFKLRTVDYGNGACDDGATFLVNGNTIAFKLK